MSDKHVILIDTSRQNFATPEAQEQLAQTIAMAREAAVALEREGKNVLIVGYSDIPHTLYHTGMTAEQSNKTVEALEQDAVKANYTPYDDHNLASAIVVARKHFGTDMNLVILGNEISKIERFYDITADLDDSKAYADARAHLGDILYDPHSSVRVVNLVEPSSEQAPQQHTAVILGMAVEQASHFGAQIRNNQARVFSVAPGDSVGLATTLAECMEDSEQKAFSAFVENRDKTPRTLVDITDKAQASHAAWQERRELIKAGRKFAHNFIGVADVRLSDDRGNFTIAIHPPMLNTGSDDDKAAAHTQREAARDAMAQTLTQNGVRVESVNMVQINGGSKEPSPSISISVENNGGIADLTEKLYDLAAQKRPESHLAGVGASRAAAAESGRG